MNRADIAGVVLAGGRSTRMGGGDKALLDLGGRPVIAHAIELLSPQFGRLAINANGDPARFADFGLPVIADLIPGYAGPLAGILAGLDWATAAGFGRIVTAAGDTPFPPPDLAARLSDAAGAAGIAIAASDGERHPVFGCWPVARRDALRAFVETGGRRVTEFADIHRAVTVDFPLAGMAGGTADPFLNINTPDDLAEARALLAGGAP